MADFKCSCGAGNGDIIRFLGGFRCTKCNSYFEIEKATRKDPYKRKKLSRKEEDKLAQDFGGRRTPASGAWEQPGDIKTPTFLIESKITSHDSFSVTKTLMNKIASEAVPYGKVPMLIVNMDGERLCILRYCDIQRLFGKDH